MPIDHNYYNRPGLYDKEAIFGINDEAVQKCICDTIEEHDIALMLQSDISFGQRNQELIIKTVANALFENEYLRTQIFPEWIFCIDEVMAYLKRNEVQPKLINEYIQLSITGYLQKLRKKNRLYLNDYIANRLSKNIGARLAEFTLVLRKQDANLNPESIKIKRKLIDDIEWEPSLYAYIYDYILNLPCVNLFKKFIKQAGYSDNDKKIEEMIYEAFEYIEIKRECTQLVDTLKSIRDTRKTPYSSLGPTFYHKKRIGMLSLGEPLGQLIAKKVPETATETQEERGRKRVPTLQGIPPAAELPIKVLPHADVTADKDSELFVDEIFDASLSKEPKPRAAVIEAGDENWEETTIPQRGSIKRNGGSLNLTKASGEIEPVKPALAVQEPDNKTAATADIVSETASISLPRLPSYTGIMAITESVENSKHDAYAHEPVPAADLDLPAPAVTAISEKPSLKERIAKIQGTVKSNPLVIVAGTLAAFTSVLGTWILTRPQQLVKEDEKKKVQLVEKMSDARVEEAMKATLMRDASAEAMKAAIPPEVMQANMDFMAPPVMAAKVVTTVAPKKEYKPLTTVVKKVDLSAKTDASTKLSSVSFSSIKELPEGIYKNMFAGESYSVDKAAEGSITGFMQDALLEMARKSPNQKEAVKAYFKMLGDLERGWLLYMQMMEENFKGKTNLSPKEAQQLKYWNNYKNSHAERGCDARFLLNRFKKLKEGTAEYQYYKDLLDKATNLMKGLDELNPDILDVNAPGNQKVVYARDGKSGKVYVLKTFMDFAYGMNLPMPKNYTGTTGEITPIKKITQPSQTFAEQSDSHDKEKANDSLSTINGFIEKLERNAAEREAEKAVQDAKTDKFLDKMLAQIEENNHQRDLDKRNNWVVGDVSLSSSGTIFTVNQPKANMPSAPNIPTVILNDIAPIAKSGTINSANNDSRSQSGVIEKPFKSSGEIITSESKDRLSKSTYGAIEKPKIEKKKEEKKSFFAGVKDKAKSLWGKLFS